MFSIAWDGGAGNPAIVRHKAEKCGLVIVDRLFERAALILGTGKKARKVEVRRERKS
jgi:hypothetical protein